MVYVHASDNFGEYIYETCSVAHIPLLAETKLSKMHRHEQPRSGDRV